MQFWDLKQWYRNGLSIGGSSRECVSNRIGWGEEVSINEDWQVSSQASHIGHGDGRVRRDLLLIYQVEFVDERVLGILAEQDHVWSIDGRRRRGGNNVRIERSPPWCRNELELKLASRHAGVRDGIRDGGIDDPAVIDPVTPAKHVLAPASDVPGSADARAEIVLIARKLRCRRQG